MMLDLLALKQDYVKDFLKFGAIQTSNGDLDAEYHVFKYLYQSLDTEEALWHSLLFIAYMHHGSVYKALEYVPTPALLPEAIWKLPMDTERRNFRGGDV